MSHPLLTTGASTYGEPNIISFTEKARCRIGKFCSISENVTIILDGEHRCDWVSTYPLRGGLGLPHNNELPTTKGDISIGNDVWLCYDSLILSGIKIGDGAVVGAGSVVTRNVKAYSMVAGNPAREIRRRFNLPQIYALEQIKWWDWPISRIESCVDLLCSCNIDDFFEYCRDNGLIPEGLDFKHSEKPVVKTRDNGLADPWDEQYLGRGRKRKISAGVLSSSSDGYF